MASLKTSSSMATQRACGCQPARLHSSAIFQKAPRQKRLLVSTAAQATSQQRGTSSSTGAQVLATSVLLATNLASAMPTAKMQVLNWVIHSLGVGALAMQMQELRSARSKTSSSTTQQQAATVEAPVQASATEEQTQVMLQMQAALSEATRMAAERAERARDLECINRALHHANVHQQVELRAARKELVAANLRIQKLKANPMAFDAPSDPAVAVKAEEIVSQDLVMDLYRQLTAARYEAVQLRAQLDACNRGKQN